MPKSTARMPRITPAVSRKLGYYVYLYINPIDNLPFYVGKGKGARVLAHLHLSKKRRISKTIRKIRAMGKEPIIELLAHNLSADVAHKVEAAAIDLLCLGNLDNAVRGHGTRHGRMRLNQAVAQYTQRRAKICEPVILIRINKLYRHDMAPVELYDATRSAWRVSEKRAKVKLAFAVFNGVCREVYCVSHWLPAGKTFNSRHNGRGVKASGRWEFVGTVADNKTRKRYVDRYVGHLFPQGAQNPISYVNVT